MPYVTLTFVVIYVPIAPLVVRNGPCVLSEMIEKGWRREVMQRDERLLHFFFMQRHYTGRSPAEAKVLYEAAGIVSIVQQAQNTKALSLPPSFPLLSSL